MTQRTFVRSSNGVVVLPPVWGGDHRFSGYSHKLYAEESKFDNIGGVFEGSHKENTFLFSFFCWFRILTHVALAGLTKTAGHFRGVSSWYCVKGKYREPYWTGKHKLLNELTSQPSQPSNQAACQPPKRSSKSGVQLFQWITFKGTSGDPGLSSRFTPIGLSQSLPASGFSLKRMDLWS